MKSSSKVISASSSTSSMGKQNSATLKKFQSTNSTKNLERSLLRSSQKNVSMTQKSQIMNQKSSKSIKDIPNYSENPKLELLVPKCFKIEEFMALNTDEILKCKICKKIFNDPVECNKCARVFCNECIQKIIEKTPQCPNCFGINFTQQMIKFDISTLETYTNKEVKCPYHGCQESYKIIHMRQHLESCIFNERVYKKELINKVIHNNYETDPCTKTHLLNYLKVVNKSIQEIKNLKPQALLNQSKSTTESMVKLSPQISTKFINPNSIRIGEISFTPKFTEINDQLTKLNEFISNSILDVAKTTKETNDKLKTMINI